jgi:hypothetical protein
MADEQPVEDIGRQHAIHINFVACEAFTGNEPQVRNVFVPNFSVTKSTRHQRLPMKVRRVAPGIAPPPGGIGFNGKNVAQLVPLSISKCVVTLEDGRFRPSTSLSAVE